MTAKFPNREARLAEALRSNLKRRKETQKPRPAQEQAGDAAGPDETGPEPPGQTGKPR